jgi:hypothetical protein
VAVRDASPWCLGVAEFCIASPWCTFGSLLARGVSYAACRACPFPS